MLTARITNLWRGTCEIALDGRPVATWTPSTWSAGGDIDLGGRRYTLTSRQLGSRFALTADGEQVAGADRVAWREWVLVEGDRTHVFRRASWWSADQVLVDGDRVLGGVRRTGFWRNQAVADLPGLDLPIQVFAVTVVLSLWYAEDSVVVAT